MTAKLLLIKSENGLETRQDYDGLPTDNPSFTGALKQGATTRIAAGGGAWFASIQATNLVGAGDRPIAADLTGTIQPKTPDQFRNMIAALSASLKGTANGVAELGADAKIPIAQIPDAALLSLGETSATAYRGDRGKTAYDHSQATGNPHATTPFDIGAAPLAGAEILIYSDFGRSATTDVWQSAFTDNTASGLQFAANTIANGTKLIIEQALSIPGDGGGAAYQVYIGPQLTGEQAPAGSTYAIAISPNIAGQNGTGTLRIEIELLGSGSSITGYVTSTFAASGSNAPWVNTGTIAVNGTQANSLDVRFNPDSVTSYVIRRNRVRRVNP